MAIKHAGLREDQTGNKVAVNAALGRLLRRALAKLPREPKLRADLLLELRGDQANSVTTLPQWPRRQNNNAA